jgi:predicted DNA-binding transcriptional regulator
MKSLGMILIALYAYDLFFSPYSEIFLKMAVFAIIAVVFGIVGWIGYSMVKAPEPKDLKDLEKGLEEVVKGKKSEG